ncbi:MAG: class I SAM-dependent RNA methyltransferase [Candidatus Krumholzibacteria bacterium]|nr:class I SAM-dependent RNA methyltransferase [Candidatus Krumholzibacteria bacterium]
MDKLWRTLMSREPVEIKKIVYGGLGLGHFEGRTIFLPYTAPGDVVTFEITADKKKVLFGNPEEIIEPSPLRIKPECPIFGICGGCHMLHLSYENEIEVKKNTTLESLERIGGIKTSIDEFTSCPDRYGYRNHSVFHVDRDGNPGFIRRESDDIVPFPEGGCLLLPEEMRSAIAAIPASSLVPVSEVRVRMDRYGTVHFWGLKDHISPPDVLMEAGGYHFPISPHSFFQVNRLMTDTLIEKTLSLSSSTPRRVLDLYCGAGFFTLPFSKIAGEAMGIESDPKGHKSALAAKKLNKISNVTFRKGRVEKEIFRVGETDLLIADPPRSGLPAEAVRGILKLRPSEIILVSCEPPTFARDASRLIESGYSLSRLHLVDMFPGTYHVEMAGLFKR